METNISVFKCFICDVECDAEEKFLGTNIARTLTTPMSTVLAKCLRTIVDTENEYFCSECTRKIEEYDQMVQLSLQIETELYELYRKKPIESCYLLDAEIITDPISINNGEQILTSAELKLENVSPQKSAANDSTESYDEMVVEYLDEYDTQSNNDNQDEDDDDDLTNDADEMLNNNKEVDQLELNEIDIEGQVIKAKTPGRRGRKPKRIVGIKKGSPIKTKATKKRLEKQPKEEEEEEDSLICKKCDFMANNHEEMAEHKANEHRNGRGKLLSCDICGRTYKSKSALSVHLAMHNGLSPHGNSCSFSLWPRLNLTFGFEFHKFHKFVIAECEMCGKTFTQRGALVRHMPMHTGERPHQVHLNENQMIFCSLIHFIDGFSFFSQCEVCGKRFIHYSSFHMHQMIHTNEKKKKCNICGQEFRSNSHITRHLRTHTGEKP